MKRTNEHHADADSPVSHERRRFFELCGKFGFTAAVVASAGGLLSRPAAAQTAQEERERESGPRCG